MNVRTQSKTFILLCTLKESATIFWMERDARERTILIAGGLLVMIFLMYAICIAPAWKGRMQLHKDLPGLRQQAADMQALTRRAAELNNTAASQPETVSQENITASLAARGMKAKNLSVADGSVRLQVDPVSFAGLLDWVTEEQKNMRLAVIDADFVALPQADMVRATLTLKQQKAEEK